MHRRVVLLCASLLSCAAALPAQQPAYKNSALPPAERVRDLLGRMTLEEKFWQLWMVPGDLDSGTTVYRHGVFGLQVRERGDSSVTDPGAAARRMAVKLNAMQHFFIDSTRLGIPIIPFEEAVHGVYGKGATVFPAAIALAATWDTGTHGARGDGDRDRITLSWNPAGALAGDQHRERCSLGTRGGDVRRRPIRGSPARWRSRLCVRSRRWAW